MTHLEWLAVKLAVTYTNVESGKIMILGDKDFNSMCDAVGKCGTSFVGCETGSYSYDENGRKNWWMLQLA